MAIENDNCCHYNLDKNEIASEEDIDLLFSRMQYSLSTPAMANPSLSQVSSVFAPFRFIIVIILKDAAWRVSFDDKPYYDDLIL